MLNGLATLGKKMSVCLKLTCTYLRYDPTALGVYHGEMKTYVYMCSQQLHLQLLQAGNHSIVLQGRVLCRKKERNADKSKLGENTK
jgi:hypothetical protein